MTIQEYKNNTELFTPTKASIAMYERDVQFLSIAKPNALGKPNDSAPFFQMCCNRLNNEATYNRLKNYFTNPNDAIDLVNEIWVENSKVWRANDKRVVYSERVESKQKPINIFEWWESEGWELYRNAPNSVGLVYYDQLGELAIMGINSNSIDFISYDQSGNISELGYAAGDLAYYFGVDQYTVYQVKDGKIVGYTDIVPYWSGLPPVFNISSRKLYNGVRTNTMVNLYPSIADYLYDLLLSKINTSFGHANVIERVRNSDGCQYEHNSKRCDDGFLVDANGGYKLKNANNAEIPCPRCNSDVAVGGVMNIAIKSLATGSQPLQAVRFVSPDVTALKRSDEKIKQDRQLLFTSGTGKGKNQSAESNNNFNSELSIIYAGESQKDKLNEIGLDLENNVYRCAELVGQLTYTKNYDGVKVYMGNDFLLYSLEQLLINKQLADQLGVSEIAGIDEQIIEVASNGDESVKRRSKAIMKLNNIIGIEAARKQVAVYELEKGSIEGILLPVNEIVKQILKQAENDNTRRDQEAGSQLNQTV